MTEREFTVDWGGGFRGGIGANSQNKRSPSRGMGYALIFLPGLILYAFSQADLDLNWPLIQLPV